MLLNKSQAVSDLNVADLSDNHTSRSDKENSNKSIAMNGKNDHEIIKESTTTNSNILGIRLLWVNPKSRRKGVAQSLVDTARRQYFYETIVPKSKIAFSQPTDDGKKFAFSYCNVENIFVYSGYN